MSRPTHATHVVATIARHEKVTYLFDGIVDLAGAYALIESGEYEPTDSNIHSEDVQLLALEVRTL